jgi:hypothetical protein
LIPNEAFGEPAHGKLNKESLLSLHFAVFGRSAVAYGGGGYRDEVKLYIKEMTRLLRAKTMEAAKEAIIEWDCWADEWEMEHDICKLRTTWRKIHESK